MTLPPDHALVIDEDRLEQRKNRKSRAIEKNHRRELRNLERRAQIGDMTDVQHDRLRLLRGKYTPKKVKMVVE